MKLATTGNVVNIAETIAAKFTGERRVSKKLNTTDYELPSSQHQFLSVLRANVEDAEQLAKNFEKRSAGEDKSARHQNLEQLLDFAHFGTLLGEVEIKLSEGGGKFVEDGKNQISGHLPLSSRATSLLSLVTDRNLIEEKIELKRNSQNSADIKSGILGVLDNTSNPELEQAVSYPDIKLARIENVTYLRPDKAQFTDAAHQKSGIGDDSERDLDAALGPEVTSKNKSKNEQEQSFSNISSESFVSRRISHESRPQTDDAEAPDSVSLMTLNQIQLPPRSPALQIADNISQSFQPANSVGSDMRPGEIKSIRFRLHPEVLGDVDIQLKLRGAKLELTVRMEREDSLRVLELGEDELRLRLHDLGLEVDSFEVVVMPFAKDVTAASPPTTDVFTNGPQLQQETWGDHSRDSQRPDPGTVEQSHQANQENDDNVAAVSHDEVQHGLRSGIFL